MGALSVFRLFAIGYVALGCLMLIRTARKPAGWQPRRYRWYVAQPTRGGVMVAYAGNVLIGVLMFAITLLPGAA